MESLPEGLSPPGDERANTATLLRSGDLDAAARPTRWSDEDPYVQALVASLEVCRRRLEGVETTAGRHGRKLLDHLIERARDDGILAGVEVVSPVLVGRAAGLHDYAMREDRPARGMLEAWANFFLVRPRERLVAADPRDPCASYIARVRALLRDKALAGEKILSENAACTRASMRAIADETGIPFSKLRGNPHVRQEVRDAVACGKVALGPKYLPDGPAVTAERIAELTEVARSFDVEGGKLPENPNRRGAPDFDRIAQLTGSPGPNGKENYSYTQLVLEIARRRGTELPGVAASRDTFANLLAFGLDAVEMEQKARGLTSWANGVANQKWALERFCEKLNMTLEDDASESFGESFDDEVEAAAAGLKPGGIGNFRRAMRRWRELRIQRFQMPDLDEHFGPALAALRLARGYTKTALAREADMPVTTLRGWERETIGVSPARTGWVTSLERVLRVPGGTLLAKVGRTPARIDGIEGASREYRELAGEVRRLLPFEAAFWQKDKLIEAVSKVTPLLRAGTEFGDLMMLTRIEENRLAPLVPNPVLVAQLEAFCEYKTVPMPYPLLRGARWKSPNTTERNMEGLRRSFRFATTERGESAWSGLGLPPEAQTIAWLAVPPIALAFPGQRAKRFADMEWKGERRGTFYTENETAYLEMLISLTNPVTGWLVQHPELAETLIPLSQTLPAQFDDLLQLHAGLGPVPLLSEGEVREIRKDWRGHLERCHRHYAQARSRVREIVQISRNPYESIAGLVLAGEPMCEYLSLLYAAEMRWHCPRTAPALWRTDVRDAAIARLAPLTGFRPYNLVRALTFTGDHRGQIRKVDGVWEIEVPFHMFKNWRSCRLFGTRTSPKNFRMQLRDEFGLYEVLDTWFFEALPGLREEVDTFPAFVNRYGRQLTTQAYGDMMAVFGARHIAWNPVTQTGFPGVTSINPYQVRHLRASDTLKLSKAANRVEEAAFAIQTSEQMIVNHYGFLIPEEAILNGYDTFSEQARKAWARIRI